jgi:deoxyadenosine/deoxycytidine kinase
MTRQHPLIVVSGNIGVGKTSLAQALATRQNWVLSLETVADNPYLTDFYEDMKKWVFQLAIYNLGNRIEQHLESLAQNSGAIIDRSIYEDKDVFIKYFRDDGTMSEKDFQAYSRMWKLLANSIPTPNVLIYLKAPPTILLERVRSRNRTAEVNITLEYLTLLDGYYQRWINSFSLCPVIEVDTSDDHLTSDKIQQIIDLVEKQL